MVPRWAAPRSRGSRAISLPARSSASTGSSASWGGGDGGRLRRPPAGDREARRHQGALGAVLCHAGSGAAVHRRGACGQPHRPREHHRHLLVRAAPRRAAVLRDGVPRGGDAGRAVGAWRYPGGGAPGDPDPDLRRARRRPRQDDRPPRSEARERLDRRGDTRRAARAAARLRDRQAARHGRSHGHRRRRRDGDAALHVARAVQRARRRPPHRHLRDGRHHVPRLRRAFCRSWARPTPRSWGNSSWRCRRRPRRGRRCRPRSTS